MALDPRTIVVLSTVLSGLGFLALVAVMRDFPREARAELRWWATGIGLLTVGWALFGSRGVAPEAASVVLANLLLLAGLQGLLLALRAFLRLPVLRWRDLAVPVLQLAVSTVFLWLVPSLTARIALGALLAAAVLVEAAVVLWRHAPRPQPMAYHVLGVSFVAMAAVALARAGAQFGDAGVAEVMQASPLQAVLFTMANLVPLVATLGFVLMINERLQRELRRLAVSDPLTGLPNRRHLADRAALLLRDAEARLGVVAIDADHFKRINDRFGHAAGDQVLVTLAERLSAAVRPGDVVGRLGGEEFVVLLPGADLDAATRQAEALRAAVAAAPVAIDGQHLRVTVSIGVALRAPAHADLDALLRAADEAMYAAKAAGRDRVVVAG